MTGANKIATENRERVFKLVEYRMEEVAYRDKLDLNKSADRLTAYTNIFNEDAELYKRYRAATSVPVGKTSLTE